MKGKECLRAVIKEVDGKEEVFCRFSLMAFKKMHCCVFEDCTLDDEIAEWEAEVASDIEGLEGELW